MKHYLAPLMFVVLAGCSSTLAPPPAPEPGPGLSTIDASRAHKDVIALGDPAERKAAAEDLEFLGIPAGKYLFEGAQDLDKVERRTECVRILESFRAKPVRTAPPADREFLDTLRQLLTPGHPLRHLAAWWTARVLSLEDARRVVPKPLLLLIDEDMEVRRQASVLALRYGLKARRLSSFFPGLFEDLLEGDDAPLDIDELRAALSAAAFDTEEMIEIREEMREAVNDAVSDGIALPIDHVRAFFRHIGPAAEPLLVAILLTEPKSPLRYLAAISYGDGRELRAELEQAWSETPSDDLAFALGNGGLPHGGTRLAEILAASAPGSESHRQAALALSAGTGRWLGDVEDPARASEVNARWKGWIAGEGNIAVSFVDDDGGVCLSLTESGWVLEIGIAPLKEDRSHAWHVFRSPVFAPETAGPDVAGIWRMTSKSFLATIADLPRGKARAELLVARVLARLEVIPARDTVEEQIAALRAANEPLRAAERAKLADPAISDPERRLAVRRLAFGNDKDVAAIEAWLLTNPEPRSRAAACITLWQIDTRLALFALATRAADSEASLFLVGNPEGSAVLLLRERFAALGEDALRENGTDPKKWGATVGRNTK